MTDQQKQAIDEANRVLDSAEALLKELSVETGVVLKEYDWDEEDKVTNQTTQDDVARLRAWADEQWGGTASLLRRAADAIKERDRLQKDNDEIVDGVKHAISELLEHSDDSDEFARGLRNHLMGTITDNHGEAYQTELDAAIKTIDQLQQRNGYLQEAAEVWERNSEDACQLWELLREVYSQAGNSAPANRRHALTGGLRDKIRDVIYTKKKPEDRITAIREERDRLKAACSKQNDEVCQILGKVLGSPWYKDDQKNFPGATEENGVCVGDHVAESLAEVAAREISRLREAVRVMREGLEEIKTAQLIPSFAGHGGETYYAMNERIKVMACGAVTLADVILAGKEWEGK